MTAPLWAAFIIVGSVLLTGCRHESKREGAREVLRPEVADQIPRWTRVERLAKRAVAGARVFATSGCTTCHTYLGAGTRNLGARDLSRAGVAHGIRFFERFVANPARYGNDVMPRFAALGKRNLRLLAIFLASSKGPR